MYTRFFGLHEKPFSITPDPRYLFMSERHGEALAHLVYGVTESGGFIQLTGEVGTGKTTLVRTLLASRMPNNADVAVVLNPQLSVHEFLATICEELHLNVPAQKDSSKALTDALNRHLLAAHADGRRTILVVDEAQNLAPAVLEQVRLLTNLETAKQKLLQIILIGQPELRDLLARNDLRQLAQRITGRYHLEPLTPDETAQYIEHRLRVAGALGEVFDRGAKKAIFRLSGGVPRLINVICDRALLGAYGSESRRITRRTVRRAAREISGELESHGRHWQFIAPLAAIALIVAVLFAASQSPPDATNLAVVKATPSALVVAEPLAEPVIDIPAEEPSLTDQLSLAEELTSADFALSALFELWNLEYTRGSRNGCLQAADAGLACHTQRGSFSNLRQLNRPAILTLVGQDGSQHDVVLVAIDDDTAEISLGGVRVSHPVSALTDLWFGQSLLLWRPPGDTPTALARGTRGEDVVWLRESLASIDERYRIEAIAADEFDAELENAVRLFQRDHRLDVDGLAGRQTQIIINSLLSADGSPRLTTNAIAGT